jgi:hypothetical protein
MDALLLVIQVLLVILLVVIPLFSGYDKWQSWSPRRKLIAAILGAGIGVVAFSQYQRIVLLRKTGLQYAASAAESRATVWYNRAIIVHPLEYLAGWALGGVLIAFAIRDAQRKRWKQVAGYLALFVALVAVSLAVKLRWWRA